jgi:anti-sigma factor RsiW
MRTCAEIDGLVTSYVDGEAPLPERAAVEAHLSACRPCRERAQAERHARDVMRVRKGRMAVRAPEALRVRCAAQAGRAEVTPLRAVSSARVSRVRRWLPLSMAASLFLAIAGVFIYGQNTRLGAALAAQLTLDHVKCFAGADGRPAITDAQSIQATLANYGWHFRVPAGTDEQHLELLGARRCQYHDGAMAHLMYRVNGHPVSLFVLPNRRQARRVVEMMGHEAVIWSADGKTYALVGREPPRDMERLAQYVRVQSGGP